uniref:CCHC-type domain-containing protein n=1 Tax=Arion vulgaris TaxID=1028688 RepID=A0A0B7BLD8_9EUPU
MTRFAKRGFDNRKLNEPTPWSEMKKQKTGAAGKLNFKEQRREDRRLKRQAERESAKVCFSCRGKGHMVSECPFLSASNQQGSCYKCGSTEHTAFSCTAKIPKGSFPFAQCFICGEKGHISKQCPDNPRGLYPKGGGCKQCGSVEHLRRDCPEFYKNKGVVEVTVDTLEVGVSADAQEGPELLVDDNTEKKKKIKVVKF